MTKDQLLNQLPFKLRKNPEYAEICAFFIKRKRNYKIFRYATIAWLVLSIFGLGFAIFIREETMQTINFSLTTVAAILLLISFKRGIQQIPDTESIKSILNEQ